MSPEVSWRIRTAASTTTLASGSRTAPARLDDPVADCACRRAGKSAAITSGTTVRIRAIRALAETDLAFRESHIKHLEPRIQQKDQRRKTRRSIPAAFSGRDSNAEL